VPLLGGCWFFSRPFPRGAFLGGGFALEEQWSTLQQLKRLPPFQSPKGFSPVFPFQPPFLASSGPCKRETYLSYRTRASSPFPGSDFFFEHSSSSPFQLQPAPPRTAPTRLQLFKKILISLMPVTRFFFFSCRRLLPFDARLHRGVRSRSCRGPRRATRKPSLFFWRSCSSPPFLGRKKFPPRFGRAVLTSFGSRDPSHMPREGVLPFLPFRCLTLSRRTLCFFFFFGLSTPEWLPRSDFGGSARPPALLFQLAPR